MNAQALHQLLRNTLSADNGIRKNAEAQLKQIQRRPGFLVACLQVANTKQVDKTLRKIASVTFKNMIATSTDENQDYAWKDVSNDDKATIRKHILECFMIQDDESTRNVLAECVITIARDDFAAMGTISFVPELVKNLTCNNMARVHNALIALRKLVKKFEFRRKGQRGPMELLVKQTFHIVKNIFSRLTSSNELMAAEMMKVCVKIYWSAMQLSLDGDRANPRDVNGWMQLFEVVLKKPLPEGSSGAEPKGQPTAVEDRNEWPWWKLKKWTLQVLHRFFSRYGNKGHVEDQHKQLAIWFEGQWAKRFLLVCMGILDAKAKGGFVTDRVLMLTYCFVNDAIELASTYKCVKPHLSFIIMNSILPTLAFSAKDKELWTEDPYEYVRKSVDPLDDYVNPRTAAINLLLDMARLRKEPLEVLMPQLASILNQYVDAGNAGRTDMMTIRKDSALVALGGLSEALTEDPKYNGVLENLIVQHVIPEFQNGTYPFMRERACWLLMRYSELEFQNEHNLQTCVQRVLKALRDPELPVQMMAATSLRFLLDSDTAEKVIAPVLPQVLQEFFRLMNEIGLDELICSLEKIIQRFGDQIVQLAPQLTEKLAMMFKKFFETDTDGDDEAEMAALTTLECINTIMEQTYDTPAVFSQIERVVVPLLQLLLHPNGAALQFLEQALNMLTWFTYAIPQFQQHTWQLFPLMFNAFDKYAFDYVELMIPSIDNFVSRFPDGFLAMKFNNTPYVDILVRIVVKTMQHNESQLERATATRIFELMLLNFRGRIDGMVPNIMKCLVGALQKMDMNVAQAGVMRVLASALYYNPVLVISVLDSASATNNLFQLWFKLLADEKNCFKTTMDKKVASLGLSSVLALPPARMPGSVRSLYGQILSATVNLLNRLHIQKTEIEKRRNGDDEEEDGASGSVEVERRVFNENEDATTAEDTAYLKFIRQLQKEGELHLLDEDDDEEEEDPASPLKHVEPIVFFYDALSSQDQNVVGSARRSLPAQLQNMLTRMLGHAANTKKALNGTSPSR